MDSEQTLREEVLDLRSQLAVALAIKVEERSRTSESERCAVLESENAELKWLVENLRRTLQVRSGVYPPCKGKSKVGITLYYVDER